MFIQFAPFFALVAMFLVTMSLVWLTSWRNRTYRNRRGGGVQNAG